MAPEPQADPDLKHAAVIERPHDFAAFKPEQIVSARDFQRSIGGLLDRLEKHGSLLVLHHAKPVAVLAGLSPASTQPPSPEAEETITCEDCGQVVPRDEARYDPVSECYFCPSKSRFDSDCAPPPQPEVEDCKTCEGSSRIEVFDPGTGALPERVPCEDCNGTDKQSPAEPQGDVVELLAKRMYAIDAGRRPWLVIPEGKRNSWRREAAETLSAITPLLHSSYALELRERLESEETKDAIFQEAVKHMRFESPEHQEEYVWQLVDGVVGTILTALDKEDSDE